MPSALLKVPRTAAALLLLTTATVAGLQARPAHAAGEPYRDPSLSVAARVNDLLPRMTLDEKIGQMTQAERIAVSSGDITNYSLGSLLSGGGSAPSPNNATSWADMYDGYQRAALNNRLGIPLIYGIDAVHGNNNVYGATIFPHNIGLGATRDPDLVQRIGRATAEEVSGTGIDWDFAPCLCVVRNDRWGRSYESFGEKPELPTSMATFITGLQGTSLNAPGSVLGTAKHFIGDGGTDNGVNAGNATLTEAQLRAIHLPPFQEAIRRGVGSVMVSYNSWNGVKDHGNRYLITDLLKGELGFSGFVVSDWNGIDEIDGQPGFTAAEVSQAVNAGIDMVMVPSNWQSFISTLRSEVNNGHVPMSRIDDANRRILTKKFELGLFEKPLTDRSFTPTVGSAAHRAIARQAVRESQVLLKNAGNILPLAKTGNKIFVAGKNADDIGNQSGGWTISWQGGSGATTPGTTILQGIRSAAGSGSTVTYNANGNGIDSSYKAAIAVVGETPYAEGAGDRPGSLGLDATDLATLNNLKASGVPVVVVLVSGRPLDIAAQLPGWNALVAAWLPGTEGNGVSDVLFGDYAPTGKLPSSWMSSASQEPVNDGDGKTPLFPFGYGLTYGPSQSTSAYATTQSEAYSSQSGTQTQATTDAGGGQNVGYTTAGDWLAYNVDFGNSGAATVTTRLASASTVSGTVQYRLDSTTGPVIATVPVAANATGGWQNWTSVTTGVTTPPTGKHTLYVTFTTSGAADLVNLNWFQFTEGDPAPPNGYQQRQAEGFTAQSGTQTETTTDTGGGQNVGYTTAGDWLSYDNIDFGTPGAASVTTRLASASTVSGTVQYRLDSTTGPVIATVPVAANATGGWQNWTSVTTALSGQASGRHTVYVTFTTSGAGDLVNLNWFQFNR